LPDGAIVKEGKDPDPWIPIRFYKSNHKITESQTTVVSRSFPRGLACRWIAILNRSTHPLLGSFGLYLQKELFKLPFVERIDYLPPGHLPGKCDRVPDWILTLYLDDYSSLWLPFYYGAHARVGITTNWTPLGMAHNYPPDRTFSPPVLGFKWSSAVEQESTLYGIGSGKIHEVAASMAQHVGGEMRKFLEESARKRYIQGSIPGALYGTYRPVQDLPFLDRQGVRTVFSGRGLFRHNASLWLIEDSRPSAVVFREIEEALLREGWNLLYLFPDSGNPHHLRMKRGQEIFILETEKKGTFEFLGMLGDGATSGSGDYELGTNSVQGTYIAKYAEFFTRPERALALQEVLKARVSTWILLALGDHYRRMGDEMWNRYLEVLDAGGSTDPAVHATLARLYRKKGAAGKAREHLQRARALTGGQGNEALEKEIEELAGRLGR